MMETAQPEIRKGRSFNAIWLIPLIAIVLGAWMVVHTWMTEGPEIEIAFATAEGLTAGKTKVRYRSVEIGVVQAVTLTADRQGIVARVKMDRLALPMLTEDARFWLVTARVGLGNISGLDTLLSGAYIELAPGSGRQEQRKFTALEKPPLTPADAPGLRLRLESDKAGSVSAGDSVIYKGYQVGRVDTMIFDADKRKAIYEIFIDAPYHELVDSSVRFWNVSGISLKAGADGFQVTTGSMDTILLGGITFGELPDLPPGEPVAQNSEFILYDDYDQILADPFQHGTYFVVFFTQSLKGLLPGAPVDYRGINVGKVIRIMLKEQITDNEKQKDIGAALPVLIYVEPGRMTLPDSPAAVTALEQTVVAGVKYGLRATLETGSLLTGAKYINIDFYPQEEKLEVGEWRGYTTIPTIGTGFDQLEVKVNRLLDKFNQLPVETTVANANAAIRELNQTLASTRAIVENPDTVAIPKQVAAALADLRAILQDPKTTSLPAELGVTLAELRATLAGFSPNSPFYLSLNSTLQQLNRALVNVESLTRTLSGKPNAAVMPSSLSKDPTPESNPQ